MIIAAKRSIKPLLLPVLITYILQIFLIIVTSPLLVITTDLIRGELLSATLEISQNETTWSKSDPLGDHIRQLNGLNVISFILSLVLVPWYFYIWVSVRSLYTNLAMLEVRVGSHIMVEQVRFIQLADYHLYGLGGKY
jgi:hypothetical protein